MRGWKFVEDGFRWTGGEASRAVGMYVGISKDSETLLSDLGTPLLVGPVWTA